MKYSFSNTQGAATHYDTLGVPPAASAKELRDAYYTLARELAPRLAGDGGSARWREITLAYGVLKSAEGRKTYDLKLKLEGRLDCAGCAGTGRRSGFTEGKYVKDVPCKDCGGGGHR